MPHMVPRVERQRIPMHTGARYSFREFIRWTRRDVWWLIAIATIPTVLHGGLGWRFITLPWVPIGLIGTAAAFIVGFKNNASYGRLWEARQVWGAIVNSSRTWAVMARDFVQPDTTLSGETVAEVRRRCSRAATAPRRFSRCSRPTWRNSRPQACSNPIVTSRWRQVIADLYDQQGKCERIKNFPYPRQFATINLFFIRLFVWVLPLGLLSEFSRMGGNFIWMTIPASVVVGWVFTAMERVGEASENPFEGSRTMCPSPR